MGPFGFDLGFGRGGMRFMEEEDLVEEALRRSMEGGEDGKREEAKAEQEPAYKTEYNTMVQAEVAAYTGPPEAGNLVRATNIITKLAARALGPADVAGLAAAFVAPSHGTDASVTALNRVFNAFDRELLPGTVVSDRAVMGALASLSATVAAADPAALAGADGVLYFWSLSRLLQYTVRLAALHTLASNGIGKAIAQKLTAVHNGPELERLLRTLHETGNPQLRAVFIEEAATLFNRPDSIGAKFKILPSPVLPEIARICRQIPDLKKKPTLAWPSVFARVISTDPQGFYVPSEAPFDAAVRACFNSITVETGARALPSDLLKLGLPQKKDPMTWAQWMFLYNECREHFPNTDPLRHMSSSFNAAAGKYAVSTCPDSELIEIVRWLHTTGAGLAPDQQALLFPILSAVLPPLFTQALIQFVERQQQSRLSLNTIMVTHILSEAEAQQLLAVVNGIVQPGIETLIQSMVVDLRLPSPQGGPVLLFGVDAVSDILGKLHFRRAHMRDDDSMPAVLEIGGCFQRLFGLAGPDSHQTLLNRSLHALESHPQFYRATPINMLKIVVDFFSPMVIAEAVLTSEATLEAMKNLLKNIIERDRFGGELTLPPSAVAGVFVEDSAWHTYLLNMLVTASLEVLNQGSHHVAEATVMMLGLPPAGTPVPVDLGRAVTYCTSYVSELLKLITKSRRHQRQRADGRVPYQLRRVHVKPWLGQLAPPVQRCGAGRVGV